MKDHNIYLATGQGVKEFEGKDGKVSVVKTDQAEYPADLVIETAGIRANTGWLKDTLDLTEKGLVKVNDHLETSQPDIYAVGDSTKVPFAPTGKELQIALATNARRQGRIAAKNVLGHDMKMPAVSGSSALSVYDYHFASTGIKEGTSDANGVKSQSVFVT